MINNWKHIIWVLGLALVMVSCQEQKRKGGSPVRSSFMSPALKKAPVSYNEKAKVVVMYEMPASLKDRPEQILRRVGYTASYNRQTKNPNWVAWHLTKDHTRGNHQRAQEVFSEDEDVRLPRATDQDYYNSRYDNHGLNKYEWNDMEILCRDWARKYGAVDIVCGPLYGKPETQKTIGKNKVWVPDAFFKVILCRRGTPKAIGFVYRNEGRKQVMEEAVRTVDEVERLTGIDFFPSLEDETERKVEAEARLSDW